MVYRNEWAEADEITLRQLWEIQKLSARQIAKAGHFEGRYTYNAIGGKAARMGLARQEQPLKPEKPEKPSPPPKRERQPPSMPKAFATEMGPEPIPDTAVTLLEAGRRHCRWPYGHPRSEEFRFCGAPTIDKGWWPYCPRHTVMAIRPGAGRAPARPYQTRGRYR